MECNVKTKEIMKKPIIKDVPNFVSNAHKNVAKVRNKDLEQCIKIGSSFGCTYVIGEPQATTEHSVQQLKDMGMIGLYHK